MKKIARQNCWLALAVAATLAACLTARVRGEEPAGVPIITHAIDAATLAKATATGNEILRHAIWKAETNITLYSGEIGGHLRVAGQVLLCQGHKGPIPGGNSGISQVLDLQTGRLLGEVKGIVMSRSNRFAAPRLDTPIAWEEGGLLHFVEDSAALSLWRQTADAPEGKALWETKYDVPPDPTNRQLMPVATFAGQQVIAGEDVPRAETPGEATPGRQGIAASLTIRSFDRKTGQIAWATPVPGAAASAWVSDVVDGRVYVRVSETGVNGRVDMPLKGFVMGLNAANGKLLWRTPPGIRAIHAAVWESLLVTLEENGEVVAYDGSTGKELWRTALSTECDPSKSKIDRVYIADDRLSTGDRVSLDKTGLAVSISKLVDEKNNSKILMERGIAILDPQTGKQTGYFDATGIPRTNFLAIANAIHDLHLHRDVLTAQIGSRGRIALNRKTLALEWYIPTNASAATDAVLYINVANQQNASPTVILALPLDAPR